eukprot:CAMPEP_0115308004 /NCGR_PEP_ID=MMETSP0270-20121206/73455_1 /TAXON_ID=71861 /ORGANISM="Scrippsiella trochoidea, Strain CCMP3099" /LENGTH=57 /DNA_ID=CAMNT_0002726509 /DNA_START=46 /DNA_END=216 /DNA_ORIENTATION=+
MRKVEDRVPVNSSKHHATAVALAALEEAAMRFRVKVGVMVAENSECTGYALSDVPAD